MKSARPVAWLVAAWCVVQPRVAGAQPSSCPSCLLGIFGDAGCSVVCDTLAAGERKDLYVGAWLRGGVTGVTSIEFSVAGIRLDPDAIYLVDVVPVTPAAILLGNPTAPVDTSATSISMGGMNVGWASCLQGDGIPLVKLTILSFVEQPGKTLRVLRRFPPTNAAFSGPVLVQCDDPVYTATIVPGGCMTLNPTGTGTCDLCETAIDAATWGRVKSLYR